MEDIKQLKSKLPKYIIHFNRVETFNNIRSVNKYIKDNDIKNSILIELSFPRSQKQVELNGIILKFHKMKYIEIISSKEENILDYKDLTK